MDGWAHAKQLNSLAGELSRITSEDYGPAPYVINIDEATVNNEAFRKAIWTGRHLQVTLMSIKPGRRSVLRSIHTLISFSVSNREMEWSKWEIDRIY